MVAPPSEPVATTDLGSAEAGRTRKLLLDEMLAERARPPLPPAPVLTVEPVPVDAAPIAGRRGRAQAPGRGRSARPPQPARGRRGAPRVVHEERQLLEEEASARTDGRTHRVRAAA